MSGLVLCMNRMAHHGEKSLVELLLSIRQVRHIGNATADTKFKTAHYYKKINKYREIYLMLIDLLNIVCKDWHIPNAYLHTYNTTL